MEIKKIPDGELEIMQVLWAKGLPMTATEICEDLNKDSGSLLATTAKLLSRLSDRGFVSYEKKGNSKLYTPTVSEDEYLSVENKSFLERVNHNSIRKFLVSLAQVKDITEDDIEALREFIREKEDKS